MSSASWEFTCPRCGNPEAEQEFNRRRATESDWCNCCGRYKQVDLNSGRERAGGGFGTVTICFERGRQAISLNSRRTRKALVRKWSRVARKRRVKALEISIRDPRSKKWSLITLKKKAERPRFKTAASIRVADFKDFQF